MTIIALRAQIFGQPNASRLVDCFRVHVCSLQTGAVRAVGDAFTTAEEAAAAADALFAARVDELGIAAPDGAIVVADGATRSYIVAPDTGGEWGERIEVRVRRAGSSDWTAI
jgi:hypothetical protein